MNEGLTEIYCGRGRGNTTLALGQSLRASVQGKSVIIIQFLKGKDRRELDILEELEGQDIKIFRFDKMDNCYADLTEEEKKEENLNILNAVNFARKVIATQECDFLVLDEVLGLLDIGIIPTETIIEILGHKDPSMHIVMTGWTYPKELEPYVDSVTTITTKEIRKDTTE